MTHRAIRLRRLRPTAITTTSIKTCAIRWVNRPAAIHLEIWQRRERSADQAFAADAGSGGAAATEVGRSTAGLIYGGKCGEHHGRIAGSDPEISRGGGRLRPARRTFRTRTFPRSKSKNFSARSTKTTTSAATCIFSAPREPTTTSTASRRRALSIDSEIQTIL